MSCDFMAYRKVCDAQAGPLDGEVLRCSGSLELDWDLDKEELQEAGPSSERTQMQHGDCQRSVHFRNGNANVKKNSVSVSPHGRFERLQEDPNYISHFTRTTGHKGQRRLHCFILRYFLAGVGIFVLGILVGWFIHTSSKRPTAPPPESLDLLEELLRGIKADKIDALQ
uniref:N-acetylated alpha-linked acidic dipeptidase like 2 n=1 Tax=Poecilia formosa TaxID=48698 RepID=A0A096M069_POEFO